MATSIIGMDLMRNLSRQYDFMGGGTFTTDLSANAGVAGRTILAIESRHTDAGDATASSINMLRCGYSGNHVTTVPIAASPNASGVGLTYGVNAEGMITISSTYAGQYRVMFICNR